MSSAEDVEAELDLPQMLPPGTGLLYDGSLVMDQSWAIKPGLYIIRPEVYEECSLARVKVGYAQMNLDETRGIAKRLGDYATSFIRFRIIAIITWRDNTEASKGEQEAHAWLEANGSNPIVHVSKRKSEWFTDVDLDVANKLVSHLLTPNWLSPPFHKVKQFKKTQPTDAYFFSIPLEMNAQGTYPSEVDLSFRLFVSWTDKDLRDVRNQMQEATDPEEKEMLRQGQLSMMNWGIDIEPLEEITERGRDRFGNRRLGSTTRTIKRKKKKKQQAPETIVEEVEEESVEPTPSAPRYNTRYQTRKQSLGEKAFIELF